MRGKAFLLLPKYFGTVRYTRLKNRIGLYSFAFQNTWHVMSHAHYTPFRFLFRRFFPQEMRKVGFTDIDGTVVCVPGSSSSSRRRRFRSRKREMTAKALVAIPRNRRNADLPSPNRRACTADLVSFTASAADDHYFAASSADDYNRPRCVSNPPPPRQETGGGQDGAVRDGLFWASSGKGCPAAAEVRNTGLPPAPTWLPLASRDPSSARLGTRDALTPQRCSSYSGPISGGGRGGSTTAVTALSSVGGGGGGSHNNKEQKKKNDKSVYDRLSIITDSVPTVKVARTDRYVCSPVGRRDTDHCGGDFTAGGAGVGAGAGEKSRTLARQFASCGPAPGFGRVTPGFATNPRLMRQYSAGEGKSKSYGVDVGMDPAAVSRACFTAMSPRVKMAIAMSPLGNSGGGGGGGSGRGATFFGGQDMLDMTFLDRVLAGITGGGGSGGNYAGGGRKGGAPRDGYAREVTQQRG